jgi:hypothetical protein
MQTINNLGSLQLIAATALVDELRETNPANLSSCCPIYYTLAKLWHRGSQFDVVGGENYGADAKPKG